MSPVKINEKVLVLKGQLKLCQATWWWLDGQWKCVGAIWPLSKLISHMAPQQAAQFLRSMGYEIEWYDRFNPDINRPKSTDTGASLSQGEQSTQRGSLNTHTDEGSETTIPTVRGNSLSVTMADVAGTEWPARAEHPVKAL